jgi:hypothetical protein
LPPCILPSWRFTTSRQRPCSADVATIIKFRRLVILYVRRERESFQKHSDRF